MTDVFDGDVAHRLRRAERRLKHACADAQVRDWTAERPSRIGFARLGQARHDVRMAADRYAAPPPPQDWPAALLSVGAWAVVTTAVLLLAPRASDPFALAAAVFAGIFAGRLAVTVLGAARRERAVSGPAEIDDPYFHADLTRRLEACAAAARADPSDRLRAAATDIGLALDRLAAAREDQDLTGRG